ncbi:MAG TPA: hypothetical protein VE990_09435 [Acidimicrobiales bacterium]|nr:hypothetical protein [Acidimicrobiales bacterium]
MEWQEDFWTEGGPGPAPRPSPPRRQRWKRGAQALALGAGLAVGGAGIAAAATGGSSPSTGSSGSTSGGSSGSSAATPPPGPGFAGGFPGRGGRGGPGGGLGGAIRGQVVVPGPNSTWETMDFQVGKVAAVDTTSSPQTITVTSADNNSQTYDITSTTSVDGGRDGIGSIKPGDMVRLQALVTNGTANVVQITDMTVLQANRATWAPPAPNPTGTGGSSASGSATAAPA